MVDEINRHVQKRIRKVIECDRMENRIRCRRFVTEVIRRVSRRLDRGFTFAADYA